jgi:voltage-gated potassium channel
LFRSDGKPRAYPSFLAACASLHYTGSSMLAQRAASLGVFPHEGIGKTLYNILLILAALAGTIVTSYRLTFRVRDFDLLYWLITAVYLLDIAYSFSLSVKKGLTVMSDRGSIARHYLRGWFAVDLVAAVPFGWLFSALSPGAVPAAAAGAAALLRIAKIGKVSAVFRDIRESLSLNPALMRLVTFGFWFVTALHLMACGWVMIGAGEKGRPAADQYLRALYWCVTTIATIGYGDYTPDKNSNLQIAYTIGVMVFGVGMYGYIIGNVATLIANLDVARAYYRTKMEEINDFLRKKRVPAELQKRVRDYYAYLWETQRSVSTVPIAAELPHSLSQEILLFLNRELIQKVSLFRGANEIFIREIVQLLRPMSFLPEDYIIRQGEYGDCMYFLSSGEVEVLIDGARVVLLGHGSPFGETALIQGEKRMASIRALTYCDVYRLAKADFDQLRVRYPEFDAQVKEVVAARRRTPREKA